MGRATVRAAVKAFVEAGNVTHIKKVYSAEPRSIPQADFRVGRGTTGSMSGAVAVVHIERDWEERVALGGAQGGGKMVHYIVRMDLYFRSIERLSESAEDARDAMIDSLKARIRSDRTLGNAGIFQAGEGENVQFEGEYSTPVVNKEALESWARLWFNVDEWIVS